MQTLKLVIDIDWIAFWIYWIGSAFGVKEGRTSRRRIPLGRNWGMPMTEKAEPELVTSGPYRLVRHPVYSGLLAGLLGTALVTNLIGLIVGAFFYYSASIEERNLTAAFPTAYPTYRTSTNLLIPFVL